MDEASPSFCIPILLHDPTPPHRPPFPTPTLVPFLSSPDPEADEDGELTYENVQVPPSSGGALSLTASGLGDKTSRRAQGMCICGEGVEGGGLCLQLGSRQYS